jgi:CheY-like chemotaxis protein
MTTRRVLVVDDQRDMREVARMGLELAGGWDVLTAASGREALAIARAEHPDAILLDVMMPDLDGPATVRELQSDPDTQSIPVILLTAEERSVSHPGVAGTLAKPFHPLRLASQVAGVLGWFP